MAIVKTIDAETLQVSLHSTWQQDIPMTNVLVMHKRTGSFDPTTAAAAAAELQAAWQTRIVPTMADTFQHRGGDYIQLSTTGIVGSFVVDTSKPQVGSVVGPASTVSLSILVRKLVEGRNRSQKNGRMYLPAPLDSDVDPTGLVFSGRVTTMTNAFAALLTDFDTSSDSELGVGSWGAADKPEDPGQGFVAYWPGKFNKISGFQVDSKCATQRRRLHRTG